MKPLSAIAEAVQASTTITIDAMYKAMQKDGLDVIGFGAGEPDFPTPTHIKEAGIAAILENKTRYTPAAGLLPLREAVCARLKADCGLSYDPADIVVSSGAKHNLYVALRTLVNPGDEIILPAPYWVSYYELIKMVGAVPVVIHTSEAEDFKISAEQLRAAVSEKTKALILNNPGNPTGMVYDSAQLREIAVACVEEDLYVIADEIYYGLVYDNKDFTSFVSLDEANLRDRTILLNGVSKSYAMTGWRIGYTASSPTLAKRMANYLSHSTSAPGEVSQWAALEALRGPQACIEDMRKSFEARRNVLAERINAIPGVSCIRPEGAFYIMMNLDGVLGKQYRDGSVISTASDFATLFLREARVAVVPCEGFGAPNYVRWSYATSMENIEAGTERLRQFLPNLV